MRTVTAITKTTMALHCFGGRDEGNDQQEEATTHLIFVPFLLGLRQPLVRMGWGERAPRGA